MSTFPVADAHEANILGTICTVVPLQRPQRSYTNLGSPGFFRGGSSEVLWNPETCRLNPQSRSPSQAEGSRIKWVFTNSSAAYWSLVQTSLSSPTALKQTARCHCHKIQKHRTKQKRGDTERERERDTKRETKQQQSISPSACPKKHPPAHAALMHPSHVESTDVCHLRRGRPDRWWGLGWIEGGCFI